MRLFSLALLFGVPVSARRQVGGHALVPPASRRVPPWPFCFSASHSPCLLSALVFQPPAFTLNSPPSIMSSAVGLCRPLSAQSFRSPQPTLHPWPEQSFLPASNFAGRIHGRKWLGRWAAGGGLGWGLPPRGSLGASSLGTCVACSHTLLPNFCRASEPDPDAPSDGGGVCGLPAISPGIITLSEWGKPAIRTGSKWAHFVHIDTKISYHRPPVNSTQFFGNCQKNTAARGLRQ